MNMPQVIVQVEQLPGLIAGQGDVPQAVVLHHLRQWETNRLLPWRELQKPIVGLSSPMVPCRSTVNIGGLLVYQDTVVKKYPDSECQTPLDNARAAVQQGLNQVQKLIKGVLTTHAMMVAWGEFAVEIGLPQKLAQVAIPQKSVVHVPYGKVLTFLMGILSGITHLKDLNEGSQPLAHDKVAIRAWGLVSMAHYTGISRTLAACTGETVEAITEVLNQVSQPFIEQEVRLLRQKKEPLTLDLDLAPRKVSNTSTTYPGAEFGWQDNEVGLGYDVALVSLTCPTYGRLFLTGFHYPRNPLALPRLQKMVCEAEKQLGLHPRRRPELVQQRIEQLAPVLAQRQRWLEAQREKVQTLEQKLAALPAAITHLATEVSTLETMYGQRKQKPYSKLALTRHRLAAAQKKLRKLPHTLELVHRAVTTHQKRIADLQQEEKALRIHMQQLQAENELLNEALQIIIRVDAGFGAGPNIAWLIEMGYLIYTKAYSANVSVRLRTLLTPDTTWVQVGKNAEMIAREEEWIANCPYPLCVALERFHTPEGLKHSTLLAYRDDAQNLTLPAWFRFYNARQTIEAGIKESNVVFKMHPLKMRSQGGIALQEQFSLFAANFVRWSAVWLRQRVERSTRLFDDALTRVKTMVRVAANTGACVLADDKDILVKFTDTGAYPGVELRLKGRWRTRPPIQPQKKIQNFDLGSAFASGCT